MTSTIDMTAISAKHGSAAQADRIRRRHWSEFRLKAYGILALALAGGALAVLIGTIAINASSVVTERYLTLEHKITVDEDELERLRDPNPQVRVALNGLVREAMLDAIEGDISRSEARQLFNLVSRDAGLELGGRVKQDLTVIGETIRFDLLLDDQIQMYKQGYFGRLQDAGTEDDLRIEPVEGEETAVALRFAPQAMTEARAALQASRSEMMRRARAEAARQQAAIEATEAELRDATGDQREALETALERYTARQQSETQRANRMQRLATEPSAEFTLDEDDPSVLIRANGGWIKLTELTRERGRGTLMEPLENTDTAVEGTWKAFLFPRPEAQRNITDRQIVWLNNFERADMVVQKPNWRLLTSSDSSNAELAGIWGALVGSFWTMVVTFLLAFPIGVMASIYLEEFAPKNRVTDFIEININNLAAVPSIVFGLLGITVLITGVELFGINLFDGLLRSITEDPRSTPLAGGVVLALMSLPTIIIAGRASIKAVPPSIRDAALGIGASKLQTATHHVLPLAMPGILTGSIIAMAQALGETAPLIIIGMNSFIQEAPGTPLDKGNVLPSLIYLWNNNSERLFDGKTAAAISVLLVFLIAMNALAVLLRRQFERRW